MTSPSTSASPNAWPFPPRSNPESAHDARNSAIAFTPSVKSTRSTMCRAPPQRLPDRLSSVLTPDGG